MFNKPTNAFQKLLENPDMFEGLSAEALQEGSSMRGEIADLIIFMVQTIQDTNSIANDFVANGKDFPIHIIASTLLSASMKNMVMGNNSAEEKLVALTDPASRKMLLKFSAAAFMAGVGVGMKELK